ncbi:hypothetical protein M2152_001991 [Microbacteriaceae bacterium SG_E_30_P1]|uniref:Uncharacterized protein n=1 Tax=Antiquaquibacter oligotrophicus TaxID=2880260 RepID=A0ABT6KRH7_9MICO|nr:hypothetical protein [Antiquaquibacter oligotrophicus]MDH6181809.1 hypothetical protein [Antiquaquibacter oligotrophicus]UDF12512.1 hypothetical protein LH407_10150 [Antiquaquibacter oligotrophicus]
MSSRPWYIREGDDNTLYDGRLRFMLREGDDGPLEPENLSEWEDWKSQWRPYPTAETFVELEVDETGAEDGYLTLHATAADTIAMGGRDGVFDIQATKDGKIRTFYSEQTVLEREVTRG